MPHAAEAAAAPLPLLPVPSGSALLHWSACAQLHPLARLLLEQRYARAILPAQKRADRLRQASRKLFGDAYQKVIATLLCTAPSHELPLLFRHLHSSGGGGFSGGDGGGGGGGASWLDAPSIIRSCMPSGELCELLLTMLRPRGDARPHPLAIAESAARQLSEGSPSGASAKAALSALLGTASDSQLWATMSALDTQQQQQRWWWHGSGELVIERMIMESFTEPTRALLLGRCSLIRAGASAGAFQHADDVRVWPKAASLATSLHKATKGQWLRSDRAVLLNTLAFATSDQAAALRYKYAMRYGHTLASAVRDELAGESHLESVR